MIDKILKDIKGLFKVQDLSLIHIFSRLRYCSALTAARAESWMNWKRAPMRSAVKIFL